MLLKDVAVWTNEWTTTLRHKNSKKKFSLVFEDSISMHGKNLMKIERKNQKKKKQEIATHTHPVPRQAVEVGKN